MRKERISNGRLLIYTALVAGGPSRSGTSNAARQKDELGLPDKRKILTASYQTRKTALAR